MSATSKQSEGEDRVVKSAAVLRAHLRDLSTAVTQHLEALDSEMNRSGDPWDRGRNVALLANALNLANDKIRFFALNDRSASGTADAV